MRQMFWRKPTPRLFKEDNPSETRPNISSRFFPAFRQSFRRRQRSAVARLLALTLLLSGPLTASRGWPSTGRAQNHRPAWLTLNEPIQREISPGDSHSYRIALDAGQYFQALVDPRGIDAGVTLYGPDDRRLAAVERYHNGPMPVSCLTEISGTYRLDVRSLESGAVNGRYELRVEEIRPASPDDTSRIAAEKAMAEAFRRLSEWRASSSRTAIEKLQEALSYWEAAGDQREAARTLKAIGDVYQPIGEPQSALAAYTRALHLSRETTDPQLETEILSQVGFAQVAIGENQKALDSCVSALRMSQDLGYRRGEARAFNCLGEAHHAFGRDKEAFEHDQRALRLWRAAGDRRGEAQTVLNLGYAYAAFNEADKAFDHYKQSLALWRSVGHKRGEALALIAIGHLHSRLGEKQEALNRYHEARNIIEPIGDRIWQASIFDGLAYVFEGLGDRDRALDYYHRARDAYQSATYQHGAAEALISIGRIYTGMGRHQEALHHYRQALSIGQSTSDEKVTSFARMHLGMAYDALGDEGRALDEYNQALSFYREERSRLGEANVRYHMGRAYDDLGERAKALDAFTEALFLYRTVGDRFGEAATLHQIARIEQETGRFTDARAHVEAAIDIVETLRTDVTSQDLRTFYFATAQQSYKLYIDLLMQMHNRRPSDELIAAALQASERARARSLLDMLTEARADIRQGVDPSLLERERRLRRQVEAKERTRIRLLNGEHTPEQAAAVEKELSGLLQQSEDVQAQIRAHSPHYAALTQPRPLGVRDIQQQVLDADTLLLEYSLGQERSYVWAVTPRTLTGFELPDQATIENAARLAYQQLTEPIRVIEGESSEQRREGRERAKAEFFRTAMALSRILLEPVAD